MKSNVNFIFILLTLLLFQTSHACTTFNLIDSEFNLFGKNYDWYPDDGLVIINKRGLLKTSIQLQNAVGSPVSWKSKYGSITFNQYGREFPTGGINEAGLVVEAMMVPGVEYSAPDARPYIGKFQWRQYQLDNCETVEEVIATDSRIRITDPSKGPRQHYLVSDRTGNCAVIEFIEGKMVFRTGEALPLRVLSNTPYEESVLLWKDQSLPSTDPHRSVGRFFSVAKMVSSNDASKSAVDYSFDILNSALQDNMTRWSIVYDIRNLQVFFRTPGNAKIRRIDMSAVDFSCQSPARVLDVNADLSGDVTSRFQDYTPQMNRSLIGNAFAKTESSKGTSESYLDMMSQYPDKAICEQ
jgi:penicillin V acylase-like amidase (Ntn superfamily)